MPLSETLHALLALQEVDSQIQRTKRTQSALDNGAQATADAQAARDEAARARGAEHRAAAELKDSELKLSALEDKRKQYQQRLYQGKVTNPKELANIEREIEALGRQRSDLDGRILDLMDQAEQTQHVLTTAEAQARQAETRQHDTVAAFQSRYEALELEIADLTRRRAERLAQVSDAALLKRYEEIRAKSGGLGIARIAGNTCGGCHMTLPTDVIRSVKEAAEPQRCENCGRLLAA